MRAGYTQKCYRRIGARGMLKVAQGAWTGEPAHTWGERALALPTHTSTPAPRSIWAGRPESSWRRQRRRIGASPSHRARGRGGPTTDSPDKAPAREECPGYDRAHARTRVRGGNTHNYIVQLHRMPAAFPNESPHYQHDDMLVAGRVGRRPLPLPLRRRRCRCGGFLGEGHRFLPINGVNPVVHHMVGAVALRHCRA